MSDNKVVGMRSRAELALQGAMAAFTAATTPEEKALAQAAIEVQKERLDMLDQVEDDVVFKEMQALKSKKLALANYVVEVEVEQFMRKYKFTTNDKARRRMVRSVSQGLEQRVRSLMGWEPEGDSPYT